MKILHYIDDFDFSLGGVVQYIFQSSRAMAEHGVDVTLVAGRNKDIPETWFDPNSKSTPNAVVLNSSPGPYGWLNGRQVEEVLNIARQHDVVHFHCPWDLGANRVAKQLLKRNIPYVISTHGTLDTWSVNHKWLKKIVYLRLIAKHFLRRAAIVHCTALSEREQVSHNVRKLDNSVCVVPYISLAKSTPSRDGENSIYEQFPDVSKSKTKLLFMSRVHVKKGLELLFDAIAILKNKGAEIQLLVAGPGEEKYIQSLVDRARRLGIHEDVLFLGMVRGALKSNLFHESDLFVLTTQQENFGIVLVEAMAYGLPVVTTRGTDIYKELEGGGAIITGFSPAEVADSLARLVNDSEDRARRGELGKAFVREWLDESKVILQHEEMYKQAIAKATHRTDGAANQ